MSGKDGLGGRCLTVDNIQYIHYTYTDELMNETTERRLKALMNDQ